MTNNNSTLDQYITVVNHEGQYSLWSVNKEIPLGWESVGAQGTKYDCLEYIKKTWIDMRPLSLITS